MLMLKNVPISDAPWRVYDLQTGTIVDANDRLVAIVPHCVPRISADNNLRIGQDYHAVPKIESMNPRFQKANREIIRSAPELLAALKEAAYHLDQAGMRLHDSYYDLINRCQGDNQVHPRDSSNAATSSNTESQT
jgi:hypothetical protein